MSTSDAIRSFIIEGLAFKGPPETLTGSTPLLENEVIDSMGILQMIGFLEDEFDIELDDDEVSVENFNTVDSISELVDRKRSGE